MPVSIFLMKMENSETKQMNGGFQKAMDGTILLKLKISIVMVNLI